MRIPLSHLLAAARLLLAACGEAPPARPNVLVICVDTLRADHLGCLGDDRGLTPAADALAARGTVFTQAIAPAPFTAPSVSSMTTGVSPLVHGVRSWQDFGRAYAGPTLAETFRAAGYETALIGANGFLAAIRPIRRGFARFEEERDLPAPALAERALAFLRSAPEPWFVWVHYFDPHAPYVDHPENGDRVLSPADREVHAAGDFATASPARADWPQVARIFSGLYAGEVAFADRGVGDLLAGLGDLADRTEIVLTADHGENLADHPPYFSHNDALYDSLLRVPLIFAGPGVRKGRSIEGLADTRDLGRTLFDLAGIDAPADYGGRSLGAAVRGGDYAPAGFVVSDAGLQKVRLVGLRTEEEKLLRFGEGDAERWFLFDLAADPGETRALPVVPGDRHQVELAAFLLSEEERRSEMSRPVTGPPEERTPEEIEQLRGFGYLR